MDIDAITAAFAEMSEPDRLRAAKKILASLIEDEANEADADALAAEFVRAMNGHAPPAVIVALIAGMVSAIECMVESAPVSAMPGMATAMREAVIRTIVSSLIEPPRAGDRDGRDIETETPAHPLAGGALTVVKSELS